MDSFDRGGSLLTERERKREKGGGRGDTDSEPEEQKKVLCRRGKEGALCRRTGMERNGGR